MIQHSGADDESLFYVGLRQEEGGGKVSFRIIQGYAE